MAELLIDKTSESAHKTRNFPKPKDKLKSEERIGGIIVPANILPLKIFYRQIPLSALHGLMSIDRTRMLFDKIMLLNTKLLGLSHQGPCGQERIAKYLSSRHSIPRIVSSCVYRGMCLAKK